VPCLLVLWFYMICLLSISRGYHICSENHAAKDYNFISVVSMLLKDPKWFLMVHPYLEMD
jgi:ethanolamine ammonia-lyase large subunit